jgi:hypothetical protein
LHGRGATSARVLKSDVLARLGGSHFKCVAKLTRFDIQSGNARDAQSKQQEHFSTQQFRYQAKKAPSEKRDYG